MSQRLTLFYCRLWCDSLNIQGPIFMEEEGESVFMCWEYRFPHSSLIANTAAPSAICRPLEGAGLWVGDLLTSRFGLCQAP